MKKSTKEKRERLNNHNIMFLGHLLSELVMYNLANVRKIAQDWAEWVNKVIEEEADS